MDIFAYLDMGADERRVTLADARRDGDAASAVALLRVEMAVAVRAAVPTAGSLVWEADAPDGGRLVRIDNACGVPLWCVGERGRDVQVAEQLLGEAVEWDPLGLRAERVGLRADLRFRVRFPAWCAKCDERIVVAVSPRGARSGVAPLWRASDGVRCHVVELDADGERVVVRADSVSEAVEAARRMRPGARVVSDCPGRARLHRPESAGEVARVRAVRGVAGRGCGCVRCVGGGGAGGAWAKAARGRG